MTAGTAFRVTCGLGFLAVALGAFGAHGLKEQLTASGLLDTYEKAVFYQFVHLAPMLVAARLQPFAVNAWIAFFLGILLFSGSLFLLALTGVKWLGAVTPFGGVSFLVGWLLLAGAVKRAI